MSSMSSLIILIENSQGSQQEKDVKYIHIRKEKIKLALYPDDTIFFFFFFLTFLWLVHESN
jgi:hypothetical protein